MLEVDSGIWPQQGYTVTSAILEHAVVLHYWTLKKVVSVKKKVNASTWGLDSAYICLKYLKKSVTIGTPSKNNGEL
jgi:hypothetical protein